MQILTQGIYDIDHMLWATQFNLVFYSPNKRSFRGPGGVGREVESATGRFLGDSALSPVVPGVVPGVVPRCPWRCPPLFFNLLYDIIRKYYIIRKPKEYLKIPKNTKNAEF